ncbi:MAG: hypothetical protein HQL95_07800 [Magnetococcales bacterium]|nr:hypothetical protein [Magnetococcales bacterium]
MQQEFGFRDIYFQLILHARGMWRHRWHMVGLAWFVCLSGWAAVAVMQDQYMASATVRIEDPRQEIADFLSKTKQVIDVTREAHQVLNGLLSQQTLAQVVRETDLSFSGRNDQERQEIMNQLRAQISMTSSGEGLYRITHRHNNPVVTRQVVEVVLDRLPMSNLHTEGATGTARTAEEYLKKRIAEYEAKVAEATQKLQEFKNKNLDLIPEKDGGYYVRISRLNRAIEAHQAKLRELEQSREEVRRQMGEIESTSASPTEEQDRKIEALNRQLQELLSKHYVKGGRKLPLYNENHADVIAIRQAIAQQEQMRQEKINRLRSNADDGSSWELEANPVYRNLKMTSSKLEVELASVRVRLSETEAHLKRLRSQETTLPAIENEYNRLQTRLAMTQDEMSSMLQQESKARERGELEEDLSRFVRFKVIERPQTPRKPVGPNRPLFSSVVLVGGLLAGLALSLFLSVIRPVFDSPASLKRALGLPVLGMVSMVDEGIGSRWAHSSLVFVLAVGGLLCVFAGVLYFVPHF